MRVLLGILGFLLLLPGLCTLGFGVLFATSDLSGIAMWIWWFIIGGGVTYGAVLLLIRAFR